MRTPYLGEAIHVQAGWRQPIPVTDRLPRYRQRQRIENFGKPEISDPLFSIVNSHRFLFKPATDVSRSSPVTAGGATTWLSRCAVRVFEASSLSLSVTVATVSSSPPETGLCADLHRVAYASIKLPRLPVVGFFRFPPFASCHASALSKRLIKFCFLGFSSSSNSSRPAAVKRAGRFNFEAIAATNLC